MLLITGSFYVYARMTLEIVQTHHQQRAQLLLSQNFVMKHWIAIQGVADPEAIPMVEQLAADLKPDDLKEYNWKFIPKNYEEFGSPPIGTLENVAYNSLLFQGEDHVFYEDDDQQLYHYYERIVAVESCLLCHHDQKQAPLVKEAGEVMGIARLSFPLSETQGDIARNNAILIVMALVTAFLAMLASYAIVRYVIVKPVIHLKDVSDAIAHGDLDQRADIRTGDEFQELSHAFNRMLRHLVTTQDDLKDANSNLDSKVDELAQANLNLHEMNKIKSEFLTTMSHELRTPLNSILGFSDILYSSSELSEKQAKYVDNIQSSGKNLLNLINDILDLAKIEAGRMELHVVDFSMLDLIEQASSAMRPLTEKKNIDMQSQVDPDLPVVTQDVGKLKQILYNLLSNAVKFTPVGGRIFVSVESINNEYFDLIVADSGIGIPLDDQAIIFEKFRQGKTPSGEDSLTREYEGTGLGLSIVKELSKLLGGEVSLESEFGKGSTFTVHLPITLLCSTSFTDMDTSTSEILKRLDR